MRLQFKFICYILCALCALCGEIFSQDYVSDTLAVRAILDSNNLYSISVKEVTDSSNGRIDSLGLEHLNIFTLHDEIGKIDKLKILILYANQLTNLPAEIGNLINCFI